MTIRAETARILRIVLAAAAIFSPVAAQQPPTASASQGPASVQVTPQDLREGLKNPTRWLTYGGDYGNHRHSPLIFKATATGMSTSAT